MEIDKKSVLIVITNFRHGGTNKSLQNFLSLMSGSQYQIDIFAMEHYGPYKSLLGHCKILPKQTWLHALISQYRDTTGWNSVYSLIIKSIKKGLILLDFDLTEYIYRKAVRKLSKKSYHTVIAFSEGAPTAMVRYFTKPNKIAWVRCDYSSYLKLNNQPDEKATYQSYKSIVCVSNYTSKIYTQIYPEFKFKTHGIYNVLNAHSFINLSKVSDIDLSFKTDVFTIVSIGRFYKIKRFSYIPDIAKSLKQRGCSFKWYIIGGSGDQEEELIFKEKVNKYLLNDVLITLGEKDNPYPYIKKSDLLVTVTLTEACPNVVNEAKILHTPIVATNFSSVYEFIEDNVTGIIAPLDEVADKITTLIKNPEDYKRIKNNITNFEYNNTELLVKIHHLLDV